MRPAVDDVLGPRGGVAARRDLLTVLTRGQLDHEVRSGQLVTPFPNALCRPWDADVPAVLRRAAVVGLGVPAALSHVSALHARELLAPGPDEAVHVTVPVARNPGPCAGRVVHRVRRIPRLVMRDGIAMTAVPDAVVTAWSQLAPDQQRAPAIAAVRTRLVTAQQLLEALDRHPRASGRSELAALVALLAAGCESELEIWGHEKVFDAPGLRHGIRQRAISAGGRRYRLDLAFERERVAVELDGLLHADRVRREADLRRDAALAAIGWLTVRFTHARLTGDVAGVRSEMLAILAGRRR